MTNAVNYWQFLRRLAKADNKDKNITWLLRVPIAN
jgi:hypothetical protein